MIAFLDQHKISQREVDYWKTFFGKTIKCGIEFEIQFPRDVAIFGQSYCENDENCRCDEVEFCDISSGCAHDQMHEDDCPFFTERSMSYCRNAGSRRCDRDCDNCSQFHFSCARNNGHFCPEFAYPCRLCRHDRGNCDECENMVHTVESKLRALFQPTRSTDVVGSGILNIVEDGSVPHGMEIITVGRRYHWDTLYQQNKEILDTVLNYNAFVGWHCSTHFHILTGYTRHGVQELEKPVPSIILANYYQLCNIFSPYLFWITSSGDVEYGLTRYTLFRQPLFDFDPSQYNIAKIKSIIMSIYNRYSMFNMSNVVFNQDKNVKVFHVEIRYPDGCLSPAAVTAWIALQIALLFKAVELSKYGLISFYNDEHKEYTKNLFYSFANLGTGDRDSDTEYFYYNHIDEMIKGTKEMLQFLKSQLLLLDNNSYSILSKLAETPLSILRTQGKTWQEIESELYNPKQFDEQIEKITEIIELQKYKQSRSMRHWEDKVAKELGVELRRVQRLMTELRQYKNVYFDRELGQPIFRG